MKRRNWDCKDDHCKTQLQHILVLQFQFKSPLLYLPRSSPFKQPWARFRYSQFSASLSVMFVADFCSVPRSTESFSKSNPQNWFLIPSCYKIWYKSWEGTFHSPWQALGHSLSSSTPITPLAEKVSCEEEEGKMVLPKGHPTNVFVVHNRAVNRTMSLHITSHSPVHSKFFPLSCFYFFISLLVAHLPFPPFYWEAIPSHGPMLGQLSSQEEVPLASACWKMLPRVVSSPPSSHLSHPYTPLSLFICERLEYHRIKRLQLCWAEKTVTPQQFTDNFPLIRDNGVQFNGSAIVHSFFENMEGNLTAVCSPQKWRYHDFVFPIIHRESWTVWNGLTAY